MDVPGSFIVRKMMTIMSMGWDYVSELRPSTGLFFRQAVYEHGNHGGMLCLCCRPHQLFDLLVDLCEIQYRDHAIEGNLDTIIFNPVSSTVPKWGTFKLLRWMQNIPQSTRGHAILYANKFSDDEQHLVRHLLRGGGGNTNKNQPHIRCKGNTVIERLCFGNYTIITNE
jgi:hypothetical protein